MRDGALTVEQLEQALRDKESSGQRLGEILVERGFVTPTQVSRVLAEQHELPFLDLARETVDMGAAGLLSEELARRYSAIPVRFLADGAVLVAVADPTNVVASDELRLALGVPVRSASPPRDAIANAITRVYAGRARLRRRARRGGPRSAGRHVVDLREAAASSHPRSSR